MAPRIRSRTASERFAVAARSDQLIELAGQGFIKRNCEAFRCFALPHYGRQPSATIFLLHSKRQPPERLARHRTDTRCPAQGRRPEVGAANIVDLGLVYRIEASAQGVLIQ